MTTPLDPLLAPRGAGEGYHQKSRVMLILGFSIVVNQKIIFILGYLQPSQGHHPGGGAVVEEFRGGGLSPILPDIMCYVNSGVFISVES